MKTRAIAVSLLFVSSTVQAQFTTAAFWEHHVVGMVKVLSVDAVTADGNYTAGNSISITVNFDQTVSVNDSGGTPTLMLETGTTDRSAVYVSGSGSSQLTFIYTVQSGDSSPDLDYYSINALTLNGAIVIDSLGRNVTLTLPAPGSTFSLGGQRSIVISP